MDLLSYLKKNPAVPKNFLGSSNSMTTPSIGAPTYQLPNNGGSYNASGLNPTASPQAPMPTGNVFTPPESSAATSMFKSTSAPSSVGPQTLVAPDGVVTGTSGVPMTEEQRMKLQSIADEYKSKAPQTSDSIYDQWLKERETGTGLYALPEGVTLTPDQVFGLRSMADDHYASVLSSITAREKAQASAEAKKPTILGDLSSSPWLEGLRINGLVQGGTADERSQNLAYLSSLPEERQKALVRSGLYNSMSTGERQKFDSYDEVVAGTQQIATMLPKDIETNPYKYVADKYSVFLGGKGTKPYQDFEAVLGRITAPIINNIYGAAVTGSELARAQTFIPDLAIDSTQRVGEKLKNLAAFAEFANDAALAKKAGMPKPSLDDYIKKYEGVVDGTYNKNNSGPVSWDNILD